jgi:hypothetical protein
MKTTPKKESNERLFQVDEMVIISSPRSTWRSKSGTIVGYNESTKRYGMFHQGQIQHFTAGSLAPSCPHGLKRNEDIHDRKERKTSPAKSNHTRKDADNNTHQSPQRSDTNLSTNKSTSPENDDANNEVLKLRLENRRLREEIVHLWEPINDLMEVMRAAN